MPGSNQSILSNFQPSDNWGMRDHISVIPNNGETHPLPASMVNKLILIFIPLLAEYKGVPQPRFLRNDRFQENFDATQTTRKRSKHGQDGFLAFQ